MPRIFITGSTDGLGLMAAELLLKDGHQVTVHARNQARAAQVRTRLPGADAVVIGDLSAIEDVQGVAEQVNALGRYDAVIHNAGRHLARMPDPTEADFFQLASAVPFTVVSRTAYDASRPVRLTMYVYRADQVRLRHELGGIPR